MPADPLHAALADLSAACAIADAASALRQPEGQDQLIADVQAMTERLLPAAGRRPRKAASKRTVVQPG